MGTAQNKASETTALTVALPMPIDSGNGNEGISITSAVLLFLIPIGIQPVGVQCFFLRLFSCLGVFPVFFSVPVSLYFCRVFLYDRSIGTLDPLFLTLGEFHIWGCL